MGILSIEGEFQYEQNDEMFMCINNIIRMLAERDDKTTAIANELQKYFIGYVEQSY